MFPNVRRPPITSMPPAHTVRMTLNPITPNINEKNPPIFPKRGPPPNTPHPPPPHRENDAQPNQPKHQGKKSRLYAREFQRLTFILIAFSRKPRSRVFFAGKRFYDADARKGLLH